MNFEDERSLANLEDELRSALRREDAPVGFATRVAARAQSAGRTSGSRWFRATSVAWAGALAAMLAVGLVAFTEHRRAEAERASREATIALRITAEKLNLVRTKLIKYQSTHSPADSPQSEN